MLTGRTTLFVIIFLSDDRDNLVPRFDLSIIFEQEIKDYRNGNSATVFFHMHVNVNPMIFQELSTPTLNRKALVVVNMCLLRLAVSYVS